MEISPALLQFLGSLAAIVLLAALAWWLRLGHTPKLASEQQARDAASEASDGFEAVAVAIDPDGGSALLCDTGGRVMLLRAHGSHFAGRILGPGATAKYEGETLVIDTGERRFGSAALEVDDASAWVQRIEAIGTREDA